MQIKFLTETRFGFHNLDITDKAVNVAFPHSFSSVLCTDNTSCTYLQCYYVIFEKVFALTELLHILKIEAASTPKILVPTYCYLPKYWYLHIVISQNIGTYILLSPKILVPTYCYLPKYWYLHIVISQRKVSPRGKL